jgi:hypothetical protein
MPLKSKARNGIHPPRIINFPSFLSNTWSSFTDGHITNVHDVDKTDDETYDEKPVVTEQKVGALLLLPTLALLLWKLYDTLSKYPQVNNFD